MQVELASHQRAGTVGKLTTKSIHFVINFHMVLAFIDFVIHQSLVFVPASNNMLSFTNFMHRVAASISTSK
jgi:hypothetical protein